MVDIQYITYAGIAIADIAFDPHALAGKAERAKPVASLDMILEQGASSSEIDNTSGKLDGVTKSFGDLAVLKGVDLELSRGDSMVLIGGSGSGKSREPPAILPSGE